MGHLLAFLVQLQAPGKDGAWEEELMQHAEQEEPGACQRDPQTPFLRENKDMDWEAGYEQLEATEGTPAEPSECGRLHAFPLSVMCVPHWCLSQASR